MNLVSTLRVLGFCVIGSVVGAGFGEAMKMAVRSDVIKEIKTPYYYSKPDLAKVKAEYAFLSPKDISYLKWGAVAGLGLGLLCYGLEKGGSSGSLRRDDSESDGDREDDGRTPPMSHYRSGY